MRRPNRFGILSCALAAVLAIVVVGCGSGQSSQEATSAEASAYLIDRIQDRLDGGARTPPLFRSASELLGNVRFAEGNGQAKAVTDAVVVGTVSDVTPGYGFAPVSSGVEGTPLGDGIQVPFESPDALWRTIHIGVDVEQVLSGEIPKDTKHITVGLAIGKTNTDDDLIERGIKALGRTVWFLVDDSPVFAYDRSLYADIQDGALIAQVMPDDSLSFPMLAPDNPLTSVVDHPRLTQLREAATASGQVVQLHKDGGLWAR